MANWIRFLLLTAIFASALVTPSAAAPPDNADPALAPWFQSLRQPESEISCCAQSDGHILRDQDWRVSLDHYQVRIDGEWRDVPPSTVLNNVDNPTGAAVVFYMAFGADKAPHILCFVRPVES